VVAVCLKKETFTSFRMKEDLSWFASTDLS